MRKLKLQLQTTLDGFIAGPQGEMDFFTWNWDEGLKTYISELTDTIDTIMLGRKLAEGFIPYWASVANDAAHPEQAAAQTFTRLPKVVFTHTLHESPWPNTTLATGDLVQEIARLKQQPGGSIMAYGGANFVGALLQHQLVDELHLCVNPVAIGAGLPIFDKLAAVQQLELVEAKSFACGIVVLHYRLA